MENPMQTKLKIFVLGNNYDGCLLTGDTTDRNELFLLGDNEIITDEGFIIRLGIRNVLGIDSILKLINIVWKCIFLGERSF
jgi:hypothetical protein